MKAKPWSEIRARKFSPARLKKIDRAVESDLMEMDLGELRKSLGRTQQELAAVLKKAQSEVSRLERRGDYKLSTIALVVAALGGELEVSAKFGRRRIKLRAA